MCKGGKSKYGKIKHDCEGVEMQVFFTRAYSNSGVLDFSILAFSYASDQEMID